MSDQQPKPLRLAECLERDCEMNWPDYDNQMDAAAELRRLHEFVIDATVNSARMSVRRYALQAINAQLLGALEELMYARTDKAEDMAYAAIAAAKENA